MSRRRILTVFNRYLSPGGEEKAVLEIHRHLSADHEMIALPLESAEWAGAGAPGILGQAWRTVYHPAARRRLESHLREHRPDLVLMHNIYPVGSPSLYHGLCRANVPVIQYAHNYRPLCVGGTLFVGGRVVEAPLRGRYWGEVRHGAWQQSVIKSAVFAMALKLLHRSGWLEAVDAWVCVSEFMRGKFIEGGIPRDRVFALPHAWEASLEPSVPGDGGHYLFLGRLVEVKGVAVLLRAWERIAAALGEGAPDLWIGGEGPLEGEVRAAAARCPRVRFLGLVSGRAKEEALRGCRAVIVPSVWWEPLGLVVYEAYDHGKPVLAAASGGLTETVRAGATGLLHAPGDAEALARDVLTLEELGGDRRREMGAAGRRWLIENTGVAVWRRRFEEIMAAALRRHAEPR